MRSSPILATDTYNNISCMMPPFALISQNDPFLNEMVCPETGCPTSYCECVHLYKIRLGDVVQITFLDGEQKKKFSQWQPEVLQGPTRNILRITADFFVLFWFFSQFILNIFSKIIQTFKNYCSKFR